MQVLEELLWFPRLLGNSRIVKTLGECLSWELATHECEHEKYNLRNQPVEMDPARDKE